MLLLSGKTSTIETSHQTIELMTKEHGGFTTIREDYGYSYTRPITDEIDQLDIITDKHSDIRVYVPSNVEGTTNFRLQDTVIAMILRRGHATIDDILTVDGYYLDNSGHIVNELVKIVVFTEADLHKAIIVAAGIKEIMKQESVAIEIDDSYLLLV